MDLTIFLNWLEPVTVAVEWMDNNGIVYTTDITLQVKGPDNGRWLHIETQGASTRIDSFQARERKR